jgi:homospermidine synthase
VARAVIAEAGVRLIETTVTRNNYEALLDTVTRGGLVVDLAYDVDTVDLLLACGRRGLRYVNASVELWDPYDPALSRAQRTLHERHMRLRREVEAWTTKAGPTAVLDHGANPGLVSHFVKRGLCDLADTWLGEAREPARRARVESALASEDYAALAEALSVKTIHISERDTQVSSVPRQVDEFVNTWSVEGLYEEATAGSELGWGTHEGAPPADALRVGHQVALATQGHRTLVRSWVPRGEIVGMAIRHGESFSISEHLTVTGADGRARYRPTVHYAYCLTDAAIASLHELTMRRDVLQPRRRVMLEDIVSGDDQFGVLLGGHDLGAWWYGCLLDIEEARTIDRRSNATMLPVAAGVLAAAMFTEQHPDAGVHLPDTLPWRDALADALPYCGPMLSTRVWWSPRNGVTNGPDPECTWTFDEFVL